MFLNLFIILKKNWSLKFIYRIIFSLELFICNVLLFYVRKKNKNIVVENVRKNDSKLFVVIVINVFGMGVNVLDI